MDPSTLIQIAETTAAPLVAWVLVYYTLVRSLRKDMERVCKGECRATRTHRLAPCTAEECPNKEE